MKKQPAREQGKSGSGCGDLHCGESVENSKRRHMMSMMSADFKFVERLLLFGRPQDPAFGSKPGGHSH